MSIPIVIGPLAEHECTIIREAAARASDPPRFFGNADQAREHLSGFFAEPIRCIFIDERDPRIDEFLAWLRGDGRFFSIPVVTMVSHPADQSFGRAHELGADDVILRSDVGGYTRRLANLDGFDSKTRAPITQGRALVAHPREPRRRVLGRILRQAGFDVSFAASAEELYSIAGQGEAPTLVVSTKDLGSTNTMNAIDEIRRSMGQPDLPAIVLSPSDQLPATIDRASEFPRVAVSRELAPPDHLLFLANELMREEVRNLRSSARMLFGTICAFRRSGEFTPVYGLTYNISREGLFVRTLDPPSTGDVLWFELRPPGRPWVVHLRGEVIWSRGLMSSGGAAPPGFGLRISEDSCPSEDIEMYRFGYHEALQRDSLFGI